MIDVIGYKRQIVFNSSCTDKHIVMSNHLIASSQISINLCRDLSHNNIHRKYLI
jgi:hypothetical protein